MSVLGEAKVDRTSNAQNSSRNTSQEEDFEDYSNFTLSSNEIALNMGLYGQCMKIHCEIQSAKGLDPPKKWDLVYE